MAPEKTMILRFEGKDGQFRLTVKPSDQFTSLLPKVRYNLCFQHTRDLTMLIYTHLKILDNVPKNVDSSTITLSNKPFGGEDRLLNSLKGVTIQRVNLRYMQLLSMAWPMREG